MDEDTRLIEEYLSGDEGAVEQLVGKYQKQPAGVQQGDKEDDRECKGEKAITMPHSSPLP